LAGRPTGVATPTGSPAFRVWLPSWRREPFRPRELSRFPTLMGFALQGVDPASWPALGFPKDLPLVRFRTKPCGLVPALQRLVPTRPAVPSALPAFLSAANVAFALLSLGASQVHFHRTWGEASPFSLPLPLFSSQLPKKLKAGAPGDSFRRHGTPPFRGAPTCLAFPTGCHLPPFWSMNPSRPIFSARNPRNPCKPRECPLSDRSHPA
jgi:hypothetical protein